MNRQQLKTMMWMRWRIIVNTAKKSGKITNALVGVLLALSFVIAGVLFVWAFLAGVEELAEVEEMLVLVLWLGLALGFFFFWLIGLTMELKRSDSMSFQNLLHLPISLNWVFTYNYLGSFVSLSMLLFLPPMIGLWLAFVVVHGPAMLIGLPLVIGFFAMITALTYQLRGWLARLMEDKRKGRTVVMGITFLLVLLIQTPNIISLSTRGGVREAQELRSELRWKSNYAEDEQEKLEAQTQLEEIQAQDEALEQRIFGYIATGSAIVPLGWLPYGMTATFAGRWWAGLLCAFGMFGIAGLSLRRSYRKTVQAVVQGGPSSSSDGEKAAALTAEAVPSSAQPAAATTHPAQSGAAKPLFVERKLPFINDQTSAVATASWQSLLRAPEGKMMLLSPIILLGLYAFMLASNSNLASSHSMAPLMSLGAVVMGLVSIQQLMQNQFGLDRDGVRSYLLSPIPRRQILLGKNLALVPIAIPIGITGLLILQFFAELGLQYFLGALLQMASAFFMMCLIGNQISILAPIRLKEIGMQAANAKFKTVLLQILSLLLVPISLSPLLLPWWAEVWMQRRSLLDGAPIYLVLQAVVLLSVFLIYRRTLNAQGRVFLRREKEMLRTLTEG